MIMEGEAQVEKKPTRWWYLVPIFFCFIGGIIAYFILKDKNRKFATKLLIIGIVMSVVWFIIGFLLVFVLAPLFVSNIIEEQSKEVEKGYTAAVECSGAYINVLNVSVGSIIVSNPSRKTTYILSVYDDEGATDSGSGVVSRLAPGSTTKLKTTALPSTGATKITVIGLCENTAKTQNASISGVCSKGLTCWPS